MAKYKQTSCHTWAKCYVCSLVLPRPQAPSPLHYHYIITLLQKCGSLQWERHSSLIAHTYVFMWPPTIYWLNPAPCTRKGSLCRHLDYFGQFQNMNLELSTQEQHLALRTCTHVLRYPSTHVHCTLYPRVQPHVPGLITYFLNVADILYIVDYFPVLFSYLRWTLTSQYSLPTQSRWFPPQWNLLGVRVCRKKLHQGQTTL